MIPTKGNIKEIVKRCEIHDLNLRNTEVKFLDRKIVIHAWSGMEKREVNIEFVDPVYFEVIMANFWGYGNCLYAWKVQEDSPRWKELLKIRDENGYEGCDRDPEKESEFTAVEILTNGGDTYRIIAKELRVDVEVLKKLRRWMEEIDRQDERQ